MLVGLIGEGGEFESETWFWNRAGVWEIAGGRLYRIDTMRALHQGHIISVLEQPAVNSVAIQILIIQDNISRTMLTHN